MTLQMDSYFAELTQQLSTPRTKRLLFQTAVDAPFSNPLEAARLGLGIVVLLVADPQTNTIHRVALSNTERAKGSTDISVKKFEDIKVPLNAQDNVIAKTIRSGQPHGTADWHYLFTPALTAEEARFNQAGGAIAYSEVYPLKNDHDSAGALIFSYFQYPEKPGSFQERFMRFYSQLVSGHLYKYL